VIETGNPTRIKKRANACDSICKQVRRPHAIFGVQVQNAATEQAMWTGLVFEYQPGMFSSKTLLTKSGRDVLSRLAKVLIFSYGVMQFHLQPRKELDDQSGGNEIQNCRNK
jgi:hypothetical protein